MGSAWQSGTLCRPGMQGSSSQLQNGPVPNIRASCGMLLSATVIMRRLPRAVTPAPTLKPWGTGQMSSSVLREWMPLWASPLPQRAMVHGVRKSRQGGALATT